MLNVACLLVFNLCGLCYMMTVPSAMYYVVNIPLCICWMKHRNFNVARRFSVCIVRGTGATNNAQMMHNAMGLLQYFACCFFALVKLCSVREYCTCSMTLYHDDVIKWKHFPRYWPFVRGIHRSPSQRPVTRGFGVFIDPRLNKRLNKPSRPWWFDTLSRSLWHHCNGDMHFVLS